MSTLQVANIHLESTGNNRIQYTGSNSFVFVTAGSNAMTINSTSILFTASPLYTSLTIGNSIITNTNITVGNSTVNGSLSDTSIRVGNSTASFTTNTTGVYSTGVVNAASHTVGNNFIANSTQVTIAAGVGLSANGGLGTSGQVLTSNASSIYWAAAAGSNVQIFSSSGTWTKPSSGTVALIQVWGAGGSGGANGGGGGGGGGYNQSIVLLSTLGATETVTIGTGGAASNSSNSGSPGGTTTFGSWVAAYGGSGGVAGASGSGGAGGNPFYAPMTANANPTFFFSRISGVVPEGPQYVGRLGVGSGRPDYANESYNYNATACEANEGVGMFGIGGGGGSQYTQGVVVGINVRTFYQANTSTGILETINSNGGLFPRNGNKAVGGAAGGGGAGRSTGAVYTGGVGSASGGAGGNNTTAAVGGTQPGGGGGGGPQTSNSIAVSAAGGNGQCIVIVI